MYQHCIPLCESGDLQAEVAADIIGLLMLEVEDAAPLQFTLNNDDGTHQYLGNCLSDLKCLSQTHTLNGSCLAQLASLFVDAIKAGKMGSGKSLELFPTVLMALSACEALTYGKGKCNQPH